LRRHALHVEGLNLSIIYSVPQGIWHNLVASHGARIPIVEDLNTHPPDTETRLIEAK
jgi:hypothetical protein